MIEQLEIDVVDSGHITNCYIVWDKDTKEATIIDPADKAETIQKRIKELNLKVKYIALTHAHKDHTIALEELIKKYNVKVIASVQEKEMLQARVDDCSKVFGITQQANNINDFILLENNEEFKLGNLQIRIINTPGHTKGSACYYIESENILITGDTLFSNCFGRCDLASASIEDMIKSLCVLYKNYSEVYIYPGHGETQILVKDTYDIVKRIMFRATKINLDNLINK